MDNPKDDNFDNFRDAMNGRQLTAQHINEKVVITVGKEYGNTDLFEMERFVKQIIATDELAFVRRPINLIASVWHKMPLAEYYEHINFFLEMYQENYFYNPFIELFYKNAFELVGPSYNFCKDPYAIGGFYKAEATVFNELIRKIRAEAKTQKFKKKAVSKQHNLSRGLNRAMAYIKKIFEKYARLMVVRIDFSFSKENGSVTSISEARFYMNRFLNNKRSNSLFANLVGYLWKIEDGESKGPHFHCLFFFDGSKVHKDVYAGMEIGKYWKKTTGGKGLFFNVNANYQNYLHPSCKIGLGMVSHCDWEKRSGLAVIVDYFFKAEQYLSAKTLKRLRTYGCGKLPTVFNSGRPRIKTGDSQV